VAIAEASRRPNIMPVPIKGEEQQAIQSLHRLRERHVCHRTALINQTRGLLSEYGIVAPQGHAAFCKLLTAVSQPECTEVPALLKPQLSRVTAEYGEHTRRIADITDTLSRLAHTNPLCRLLLTIPGIGPIIATAIYSAIGNGTQFNNAREFAVWLGLTPRQASSGNSFTSGGITKRGNRYLRKQLVHGARAAISRTKNKNDKDSRWANRLIARRGKQKACVAMAARMARLAWTLLQKQEPYQARH
jgi:transposase